MPAKRPNGAASAKPAKRPRLAQPPIEPFTVEALSQSLVEIDSKAGASDAGNPRVVELLELELTTLDPTWLRTLSSELRQPYFHDLKRYLWRLGLRAHDVSKLQIFPPASAIYTWSRHTPLDRVRVVILGQDPYHNDGQAHGLSFSVPKGIAVPASLRNIYKELAAEYPGFVPPKHGNLEAWAKAGVLLLNASLTVTAHQAASHAGQGWEEFTSAVVEAVNEQTEGVVFLAWGKPAEKGVAKVDRKKHLVLTSPHPSPLSAARGFFGNGHFRKANEWLKKKYGDEGTIDWTDLDGKSAKAVSLHDAPTADADTAAAATITTTSTTKTTTIKAGPKGADGVVEMTAEIVVEERAEIKV